MWGGVPHTHLNQVRIFTIMNITPVTHINNLNIVGTLNKYLIVVGTLIMFLEIFQCFFPPPLILFYLGQTDGNTRVVKIV